MLKKIWDFCGNVWVNFWLLLLISLNLGIGSYYLKFNFSLFNTLNHLLIQEWVRRVGLRQSGRIWWLGTLLLLLFFLGANTLICALKRLIILWPLRRQLGFKSFSIRISPSLIHLGFLVILVGHGISLVAGYNQIIPAKPGTQINLPGSSQAEVISQACERYASPAPIRGMLRQCSVILRVSSAGSTTERQIRFLEPLSWQGLTFHLDMSRSNNPQPELKIIIKEDPGRNLIFWGFAFLILFMLWYFPQRKSV